MKIILYAILFLYTTPLLAQEDGHDISLPDPGPLMEAEKIPFSFDAPGWYFLFLMMAVFSIILIHKWYKKYKHNTYRRTAIKELNRVQLGSFTNMDALNIILVNLKLVAIQSYGRNEVAKLDGEEWYRFLESTGKSTPFSNYGTQISKAIYKEEAPEDNSIKEVLTMAKKWIKTHA